MVTTLRAIDGGDPREFLVRVHARVRCDLCGRRTNRRLQLDRAFPDWWLPLCARCSTGGVHLPPLRLVPEEVAS